MKNHIILLLSALSCAYANDGRVDITTSDGTTYLAARITENTDTYILAIYKGGAATIDKRELSQADKEKFGYSDEKYEEAKRALKEQESKRLEQAARPSADSFAESSYALYLVKELHTDGFIAQVYTFKNETTMDPNYAMAMMMAGERASKSARAAMSKGGSLVSGEIPTVTTRVKELSSALVFIELGGAQPPTVGSDFSGFFRYAGEVDIKSEAYGNVRLSNSKFVGATIRKEK